MRITAQYADEWNVWGDVAVLRQKMAVLDGHCAAVGRRPEAIKRTAVALLFMSEDADWLEGVRQSKPGPAAIIGTMDEVRETVRAYADIGVDELIVPDFNLGDQERKVEVLDRFIKEVAGR